MKPEITREMIESKYNDPSVKSFQFDNPRRIIPKHQIVDILEYTPSDSVDEYISHLEDTSLAKKLRRIVDTRSESNFETKSVDQLLSIYNMTPSKPAL